jgi:hypothetical protein
LWFPAFAAIAFIDFTGMPAFGLPGIQKINQITAMHALGFLLINTGKPSLHPPMHRIDVNLVQVGNGL